MDLKSRMGHNIAEVRRFLGYSVAELSEKTGMTPDRLAKIEAGEVDFDMDECEIIGKALNTDVSVFAAQPFKIVPIEGRDWPGRKGARSRRRMNTSPEDG